MMTTLDLCAPLASARGRCLRYEPLEVRNLFASYWLNPRIACDVNDSGMVTPLDALLIINDLSRYGGRGLSSPPKSIDETFVDVNGDQAVGPLDALLVINALADYQRPLTVAAGLSPESDPNGNGVVLVSQMTLQGQTLPGAVVESRIAWDTAAGVASHNTQVADSPAQQVTADDLGRFRFTVAQDELGHGTVHLTVTDRVGRRATLDRVVRRGDVITDWNASMLNVIRDWTTLSNDPYANRIVTERPPVAARNLAMMHAAMYDAVNAIERTHQPYRVDVVALQGTSPVAAAAAAAHRVATGLYREPDELAVWDAALVEALASVPDGTAESLGVELGQRVGDAMLACRAHDGSAGTVAYAAGHAPGDWNRTFPDFLPPLLPQWPGVMPFAMTTPDQFRPPAPPELTSAEYAEAVDEVFRLGGFDSSERTPEQTEIALFWADGGGTFTPPGHWNQIAADVALSRGNTLAENALLFALLNLALADAGISAWDAKYAFDLWRPIDAIRKADVDENSATVAQATWTPLLKTPPFPSYTSGHSTFSGAADAVLTQFFGSDVAFASTTDGHNGFTQRPLADQQVVTRSFTSFTAAAAEAGRSRIYGGIHFEFDNVAGLSAGRAIGSLVVNNLLMPIAS